MKFKAGDKVLCNVMSNPYYPLGFLTSLTTGAIITGIVQGYEEGKCVVKWDDDDISNEFDDSISFYSKLYYDEFLERIKERLG